VRNWRCVCGKGEQLPGFTVEGDAQNCQVFRAAGAAGVRGLISEEGWNYSFMATAARN
jgi:hypothetical protein